MNYIRDMKEIMYTEDRIYAIAVACTKKIGIRLATIVDVDKIISFIDSTGMVFHSKYEGSLFSEKFMVIRWLPPVDSDIMDQIVRGKNGKSRDFEDVARELKI
jgi:hypothetical protein